VLGSTRPAVLEYCRCTPADWLLFKILTTTPTEILGAGAPGVSATTSWPIRRATSSASSDAAPAHRSRPGEATFPAPRW
jgi:hypothetical protein